VGLKSVSQFFQLGAQLEVIVDLPVEGDSEIAILGEDRLVSGVQIDNFQTGRTYRKKIRLKNALLVRPPVNQRRGCLAYPLRRRAPVLVVNPAIPHNSGHLSLVAEQTRISRLFRSNT